MGEKEINAAGCATGKYISQGGISGRTESTGLGVFHVLNTLLEDENFCDKAKLNTGMKGKKIIVQGFGNVGYHFASFCHKKGAKIVGIIERGMGMYNPAGFDPQAVKMHIQSGAMGRGEAFPDAEITETRDPMKIMAQECDVFAPCAADGALNANNCDSLKCKVVIEGANGPTTFKAD